MEHAFQKNQVVSFERNSVVKSTGTPIIALCPIIKGSNLITYIVENENGWIPNLIRKNQYDLDESKKYLFVSESELTAVV